MDSILCYCVFYYFCTCELHENVISFWLLAVMLRQLRVDKLKITLHACCDEFIYVFG